MSSSLSLASIATHGVYYNLTISHGSSSQEISLNVSNYHFTAYEGGLWPPCEVYNFSVTAAYVGAIYSGDGCSVHLETLMLYSRSTNEDWREVNLFGELILNIRVEVSIKIHIDLYYYYFISRNPVL